MAERSKNQQDKFNKVLNAEIEAFLRGQFVPKLFGTVPTFEDIMQCIQAMETEINSLGQE